MDGWTLRFVRVEVVKRCEERLASLESGRVRMSCLLNGGERPATGGCEQCLPINWTKATSPNDH